MFDYSFDLLKMTGPPEAEAPAKRKGLFQVLKEDAINFVYFFLPLVIAHNVAW